MCLETLSRRFTGPSSTLHKYAIDNNWQGIQVLLAEGHDVNERSGRDQSTALHYAAHHGSIESLAILLAGESQIDSVNKKGLTPLLSALKKGEISVVKYLISEGASIHVRGSDGWAVLHYVCVLGLLDVLLLMISKGVDLNCRTSKELRTALHLAAICNNKATCEFLIRHGALKDLLDAQRRTPLHCAAMQNNVEAAKVLIHYGADLNIKGGKYGRTALHLAVAQRIFGTKANRENKELIELLLTSGAHIDVKDRKGYTAYHIALKLKRYRIQEILVKYNAASPSFMDILLM